MRRLAALAAVMLVGALSVSCAKTKPVEIPVPEGVDLGAAAEIGDSGNGLWLLDGPSAASRVIDAMRTAGGGTMTATVHELVPVEKGDPLPGRTISVVSRTDGVGFEASITAGDQSGELVVVGQSVWVKGNAAFAARVGVPGAEAPGLGGSGAGGAGDFVCVARGAASISEFEALADPAGFLRTALIGLEMGVLGPTDAAPDVQTLVLGAGGSPIGELAVEARGAPLPQRLFVADQTGTIAASFTWGGVSEIRPPSDSGNDCG